MRGYWILVFAFFIACTSQRGLVDIKKNPDAEVPEDSVEYELIIFDVKFDTWYILQDSPARYRSNEYYESWNRRYVSEWNYKAMSPRRYDFFEPIIGYEPTVEYGFELNHKLFYYFQYVEKILKIPILNGGGPHVPLI